jgi:hypothetical protein
VHTQGKSIMRKATPAELEAIDAWWNENDPSGNNYDCMDNQRIALVDNPEEQSAYQDAQMNGCCGSVDVRLKTAQGIEFDYGFNYGH